MRPHYILNSYMDIIPCSKEAHEEFVESGEITNILHLMPSIVIGKNTFCISFDSSSIKNLFSIYSFNNDIPNMVNPTYIYYTSFEEVCNKLYEIGIFIFYTQKN